MDDGEMTDERLVTMYTLITLLPLFELLVLTRFVLYSLRSASVGLEASRIGKGVCCPDHSQIGISKMTTVPVMLRKSQGNGVMIIQSAVTQCWLVCDRSVPIGHCPRNYRLHPWTAHPGPEVVHSSEQFFFFPPTSLGFRLQES